MTSEHGTKVDLLITQTDPAALSYGDRLIVEGMVIPPQVNRSQR